MLNPGISCSNCQNDNALTCPLNKPHYQATFQLFLPTSRSAQIRAWSRSSREPASAAAEPLGASAFLDKRLTRLMALAILASIPRNLQYACCKVLVTSVAKLVPCYQQQNRQGINYIIIAGTNQVWITLAMKQAAEGHWWHIVNAAILQLGGLDSIAFSGVQSVARITPALALWMTTYTSAPKCFWRAGMKTFFDKPLGATWLENSQDLDQFLIRRAKLNRS